MPCLTFVRLTCGTSESSQNALRDGYEEDVDFPADRRPVRCHEPECPCLPELIDKVLAVVNKDVVLASQQEALVNKIKFSAKESGQALPDDATLRKQALDRLIQESLQLQLADRQGLKISDTQLEQAINSIAADNKMNLEQLRAQLDREGLSYAQYREEVRREILMNEVRRNQIRRRINISDQEVKQVVQALQKQGQQQQEFHVGHIQIALPDNPSTEQLNAAKAKIDSLLKRLRDGADFRELAIAESNGPKALEGGLGLDEPARDAHAHG